MPIPDHKKRRYFLIIAIGWTPFAVLLAIVSGGAGDGNYFLARLLFPYTMLLTLSANDTITIPLMLLAIVQFPAYGFLLHWSDRRGRLLGGALVLIAVHAVAAALCFAGLLPNFS